jgi:hypothetical protein
VDVPRDLVADDGELRDRGVDDPLLERAVALDHHGDDRDEHEQQREQREEAVVRDQRREVPGAVVAELLDDGEREREPRTRLLRAVDLVEVSLESVQVRFLLGLRIP